MVLYILAILIGTGAIVSLWIFDNVVIGGPLLLTSAIMGSIGLIWMFINSLKTNKEKRYE